MSTRSGHRDQRIVDEHHNLASSMEAGLTFGEWIEELVKE
jgi:hypothetical protein